MILNHTLKSGKSFLTLIRLYSDVSSKDFKHRVRYVVSLLIFLKRMVLNHLTLLRFFEFDHNFCLTMPTIKQFSTRKRRWKLTTTMAEHRPGVGLSLISLYIMILVHKTVCYLWALTHWPCIVYSFLLILWGLWVTLIWISEHLKMLRLLGVPI